MSFSSSKALAASSCSSVTCAPASMRPRSLRAARICPAVARLARSMRCSSMPSTSICCTPRARSASVSWRLSSVASMATSSFASSMLSATSAETSRSSP